jgi:hypothetical protein
MPTYDITGLVTISVTTTVEALNEKAARRIVEELQLPGLCWQCSAAGSDPEDEVWCVDELDGEPRIDCVKARPA